MQFKAILPEGRLRNYTFHLYSLILYFFSPSPAEKNTLQVMPSFKMPATASLKPTKAMLFGIFMTVQRFTEYQVASKGTFAVREKFAITLKSDVALCINCINIISINAQVDLDFWKIGNICALSLVNALKSFQEFQNLFRKLPKNCIRIIALPSEMP